VICTFEPQPDDNDSSEFGAEEEEEMEEYQCDINWDNSSEKRSEDRGSPWKQKKRKGMVYSKAHRERESCKKSIRSAHPKIEGAASVGRTKIITQQPQPFEALYENKQPAGLVLKKKRKKAKFES